MFNGIELGTGKNDKNHQLYDSVNSMQSVTYISL